MVIPEKKKMIKLGDLLHEDHKETLHKGKSKSGLDWDADKDNPEEDLSKLENTLEGDDLIEMYEGDLDDRPIKSYIMSIHKMAAELYNVMEDTDDPEEWVMEKAKTCSELLNAVHGHVTYSKNKAEELNTSARDEIRERGW